MNALLASHNLESWRLLIVQRDPTKILLHAAGPAFSLPEIAISTDERSAASINREVERRFGLRLISLYEIETDSPALQKRAFYHAALLVGSPEPIPADTIWMSIGSLAADSFRSEEDFAAIGRFEELRTIENVRDSAEPFLKLTWFAEATDWVSEALRPYSLRLTGPVQQFNACSTFSLLRFETSGTPVWFKAVGAPNTREYAITMALARICPASIPKVLAVRSDWSGWLSLEASGTSLLSDPDFPRWECAARSLARLQIQTIPVTQELARAGGRDFGLGYLGSCVAPFMDFFENGAIESGVDHVPRLSARELAELRIALQHSLATLDGLALPDTAGHMDLNPQNIFCTDHECVFLDWAEAFIGCPFLSFEYLLQHFRRAFPSQPAMEAKFQEAYLVPWRGSISSERLAVAMSLSPLAALFAYATTLWRHFETQESPRPLQWEYFLRLIRRMNRLSREREGVAR